MTSQSDSGNQIKRLLDSYEKMVKEYDPKLNALQKENEDLKEEMDELKERWEKFNLLWDGEGGVDGKIGYKKVVEQIYDQEINRGS